MKPFIVVADGFDSDLFNTLQTMDEFTVHPKAKSSQGEIQELAPEIEGLVIRSATTVTPEFLARCPKLKYVIRAGEGTDNIDKAACRAKDVRVSNTPGANNNSAAEHAIALMMTTLRKTAAAHASMQAGKWEKAKFTGNELTHKTVGIVGFGRIGQIVAKRISGFEPQVLFYDPFVNRDQFPNYEKIDALAELFKRSDIITLHVPLIPATKNSINKALLSLMKPSAILVNCARGGIVNEDDLLATLKEQKIRGAAFDVFANEPLPTDSPLLTLENLVLTPHLGASTEEAQVRVGEMVIHQLKEFFVNKNLMNEVKA